MLSNNLKISLRNLAKNKVYSFINIAGLAAGLSCSMLICLYVQHELSYDTHHPDVDQLYQVGTVFVGDEEETKTAASPPALAAALAQEYPEIVNTTRIAGLFVDDKTLLRHEDPQANLHTFYESGGYLVDSSFFEFFHYDFIEGDAASALRSPNSIILCEDIARKIFGKGEALGQTIQVQSNTNGDGLYTVTGVFAPGHTPSHIDARFFMTFAGGALEAYTLGLESMAGNNFMYTYLKLLPGADAGALEAKMPAFIDKYMRKDLEATSFDKKQFLTAVEDIHLFTDLTHNVTANGSLSYVYILLSIAVFTILIACINFMNLSTARASKRAIEVGIRKSLGAQQSSLMGQFLNESLLFSLFAFVLALGLVFLCLPGFELISGKSLAFSGYQGAGLFGAFLGISLLAGLLAGSYPAFYLSSFRPAVVLKGHLPNSLATISLRKGLVVFQFTLSVVLIISVLIIQQQMSYLRSADLGFEKGRQVVLPLRGNEAKGQASSLKTSLKALAGVASVGASAYYPGIFNPEDASFYGEGQTSKQAERTRTNRVDYDYIHTLKIGLVAGRLFSAEFPADTNQRIILNEQAVKACGYASAQEAVGKRVFAEFGGETVDYTIIGVVNDFHFEDLHTPITPYGFTLNQSPPNYLIVHLKAGDQLAALQAIESVWKNVIPGEPIEYSFLQDEFQKNYLAEDRLSKVVAYFTFIAILISCLGLFGLAVFTAEQRTKEIGIRKVLGASVTGITALLAKDFLQLVLLAVLLATPLAWYFMNAWLADFAYRIELQWWMFVLAGAAALLIALLTVSFQSIRAALANPVKSLRSE